MGPGICISNVFLRWDFVSLHSWMYSLSCNLSYGLRSKVCLSLIDALTFTKVLMTLPGAHCSSFRWGWLPLSQDLKQKVRLIYSSFGFRTFSLNPKLGRYWLTWDSKAVCNSHCSSECSQAIHKSSHLSLPVCSLSYSGSSTSKY